MICVPCITVSLYCVPLSSANSAMDKGMLHVHSTSFYLLTNGINLHFPAVLEIEALCLKHQKPSNVPRMLQKIHHQNSKHFQPRHCILFRLTQLRKFLGFLHWLHGPAPKACAIRTFPIFFLKHGRPPDFQRKTRWKDMFFRAGSCWKTCGQSQMLTIKSFPSKEACVCWKADSSTSLLTQRDAKRIPLDMEWHSPH